MSRDVTHRTWYRLAITVPGRAPLLVAAQGEHLGEAVAAAEQHVDGAVAFAAAVASEADIPLGESVGKHHVVTIGEAVERPAAVRWPSGVLPAIGESETVARVQRGFAVHRDERLLVVEAVLERDELDESFLSLAERLPAGDNLEVRVLDHFEDTGMTDVWLTSRVNADKIIRFLDDHDVELLGNGHVEVAIYVRAKKGTLRLTEHKTVVWVSEDRGMEAEVVRWFAELDVPRIDPLVTIASAPHFHYRPLKSRDRKKLGEQLYRQRLRRVDTLRSRETAG